MGNLNAVKVLLGHGFDPNARCSRGNTPLIEASLRGYMHIVSMLLERDADPNISNDFSETALTSAIAWGHLDTVRLLVEYGAEVNVRLSTGETALMLAILNQSLSMIEYLIQNGAELNCHIKTTSLLEVAVETGSPKIVRLITESPRLHAIREEDHAKLQDLIVQNSTALQRCIEQILVRGKKRTAAAPEL